MLGTLAPYIYYVYDHVMLMGKQLRLQTGFI